MSESSRIDEVRAQYPHLQDVAYFNTGTYGSMADCVLRTYQAGTAEFERYGLPVYQQVLDRVETVRARIAERLRGQPSEISLTRNATDGVNLVVTGLDWQPGDEIIISDQEHPAMDQPWSWLAQTRGTVVRRFAVSPDPAIALANVRALITPRTRLIGSSWVTSALGIRLPARGIARAGPRAWCLQPDRRRPGLCRY